MNNQPPVLGPTTGARPRRIRAMAAGVLFLSGGILGFTAGRLSWLVPPLTATVGAAGAVEAWPVAGSVTFALEKNEVKAPVPTAMNFPPVVLLNPNSTVQETTHEPPSKGDRERRPGRRRGPE
jgi:hypothetical protein